MLDAGLIGFYCILNYDIPADSGAKTMINVVENLAKMPVPLSELAKAKNKMESDNYRMTNSLDRKAGVIGYYYLADGDWDVTNKELEAARSLTPEDIQKVAARYLKSSNRNVILQNPVVPFTGDTTKGGGQ